MFRDGYIYCNAPPLVYCFAAETGQKLWTSTPPPPTPAPRRGIYPSRPATQSDNQLFQNRLARTISLIGENVYCIENETTAPANRYGYRRGGQVKGNALAAYECKTGKKLWRIGSTTDETGAFHSLRFMTAPVRAGSHLLVPAEGTSGADKGLSLLALDAATGKLKWKFKTGDKRRAGIGGWGKVKRGIDSSAAVVGGVVYFGCWDGFVYALEAEDGSLKWKYDAKDLIHWSSPAVASWCLRR